jgi:RNA polymerase sigma-70 factor (ECF subfamily)
MGETHSSLIRRVRDPADADSWREFVALYEPLLLSYVRSRGLGEHDARDVVQDIFARLLQALPAFELDPSRGGFRSWLWQVTCHAVADWARRGRRQHAAENEWHRRLTAPAPSDETGSEAEWLAAHRRRVLEFVLEQVRGQTQPPTWACFEQHVLHGRRGADVAAELGITANAVFVNASRVLARVREQCAEYLEELGDG